MKTRTILLLAGTLAWSGLQIGAQEPAAPAQTTDAAPAQGATAVTQATDAAATQNAAPAAATPQVNAAPQAAAVPHKAAAEAPKKESKGKAKKVEYTGPNTIIELPATPMLDDEGKQRLDPDGKPMFNPPVKQQRDKKGHPLFDDSNKPVMQTKAELGYDEKGKKLHAEKEKNLNMKPVSISRGTLTVDGMTGKAALNYDIADLKFIYIFAPGIGIAVVSNEPFQGGTEQKKAFNDKTLTVNVGPHTLQIASDKRLLGKSAESAYVMLDRQFVLPSKFPVVGYGTTTKAPYVWPGAKANEQLAGTVAPPPPSDLLPVQLLKPCPAGQMRVAAARALPGQPQPEAPCVPIPKGTPAPASAAPAAQKVSAASVPANKQGSASEN
jgi:hypothetical protein